MKCFTVLRRVVWPVSASGPWIPFSAAQVAARRAAQMVPLIVCVGGFTALPVPALAPAPAVMPPRWATWQPPVELVPDAAVSSPPWVQVSAPGGAGVLAFGLVVLWGMRR